jgi:hypothetical protein
VRAEDADGLSGLDQQCLVGFELVERADDRVVGLPRARRAARAAVDDEVFGCSATSGSRLFMSMRFAASAPQLFAVRSHHAGADGARLDAARSSFGRPVMSSDLSQRCGAGERRRARR